MQHFRTRSLESSHPIPSFDKRNIEGQDGCGLFKKMAALSTLPCCFWGCPLPGWPHPYIAMLHVCHFISVISKNLFPLQSKFSVISNPDNVFCLSDYFTLLAHRLKIQCFFVSTEQIKLSSAEESSSL